MTIRVIRNIIYGIYIIRFDVLTRRSNMSASSSSKQERSEDGRSEISPFSAAHAQHTNNRCKSQLAEPSGCVVRGRSATSPRLCGSGFSGRGAAGKPVCISPRSGHVLCRPRRHSWWWWWWWWSAAQQLVVVCHWESPDCASHVTPSMCHWESPDYVLHATLPPWSWHASLHRRCESVNEHSW